MLSRSRGRATVLLGRRPMTDGQVVTVLVGVGLDLVARHRAGRPYGVINPADVVVDDAGRPSLRPPASVTGYDEQGDREAWLRLGWALAAPGSPLARAVADWARVGEGCIERMVPRLLDVAAPEPLAGPAATREVSPSRRGRHAARRRWWGPGR